MTLLLEIAPYSAPMNPNVLGLDVYQRFERGQTNGALADDGSPAIA